MALKEGKIGTLWTPGYVDNLRWRVKMIKTNLDEFKNWYSR
jgi:hypothetical protein